MKAWPGQPYPQGGTWDGAGVNFARFSEHATGVELCLFEGPDGKDEVTRIRLTEHTDQVWHAYLPEVRPGQLYGYRVQGVPHPTHLSRADSGSRRWSCASIPAPLLPAAVHLTQGVEHGGHLTKCLESIPCLQAPVQTLPAGGRRILRDALLPEIFEIAEDDPRSAGAQLP